MLPLKGLPSTFLEYGEHWLKDSGHSAKRLGLKKNRRLTWQRFVPCESKSLTWVSEYSPQ